MHPLVAIVLVFLTVLAWTGTVLTLLVTVAKRRRDGTTAASHAGKSAEDLPAGIPGWGADLNPAERSFLPPGAPQG